ncbi:hypothetical protein F4X10_05315 [Candidatus Poribacteria bacterium]|nr:hypothetical protein [Candidatus Poribacteria bacterium]
MKTFLLCLSILFCAIALPAFGELTVQDFEKIRQIVKASETALTSRIETVESKVDAIDTRLRIVETGVAELRGRSLGFGVLRDWIVTICALGALVLSIFTLMKTQSNATQTTQTSQKSASP